MGIYAFLQEMLMRFISFLNFGKNFIVQLRWNWLSVRLPVINAWKFHSMYTTFSNNVGAWGMWACSLFLPVLANFQHAVLTMLIYTYWAVAKGQSGILYLSKVSLYPLGVHLTSNNFDATLPLLVLWGGRGAKILNFIYITMASSKKRCYPTALDLSFSDEEISTSVEQLAPLHHTWGANIWKSKKCHHFFIQKGRQGIIDTLKSVKKLR